MNWLSFLTPKYAIIASFVALLGLLAVQSYRLSLSATDYAKLETEKAELKGSLMATISANESNLILINRYQKANKALIEHNAQSKDQADKAKSELTNELNEIKERYDKARKVQVGSICGNFIISDDVIELLEKAQCNR
jgi:ABC-type transport system involved in cytochrome bd biosynthesis fused ATPase/permease subunit